jgi:DNA-binding NarL/FixJ family response regulator
MENTNKKIVILLNDNDALMSLVCKKKFQKEEGWDSIITNNYDEAINKIKEIRPDIVLTNIILKSTEKNGFDLISEIRSSKDLDKINIVVFTELGQDSDIEKAKMLGANEYYIKSQITIRDLIDKVKNILLEQK